MINVMILTVVLVGEEEQPEGQKGGRAFYLESAPQPSAILTSHPGRWVWGHASSLPASLPALWEPHAQQGNSEHRQGPHATGTVPPETEEGRWPRTSQVSGRALFMCNNNQDL